MSMSDDIGLLNQASLEIGEVIGIIETASQGLDGAQNKILNILQLVAAVRGDLNSPTLANYATSLRDALEEIRRAHNAHLEAIISLNKGNELGREYISRLHG
jgi:hypothetical protein